MLNEEAVLFANDAFYLALSQGDYPAMEAIWANEAQVCCLHPGWEPLFGRTSVLESWRGILENPPSVECLDPRAIILDHAAIVNLLRAYRYNLSGCNEPICAGARSDMHGASSCGTHTRQTKDRIPVQTHHQLGWNSAFWDAGR